MDGLLEEYLGLLDQYDTLQRSLSSLQISMQQNIARANFHAQRGIRYGEELYDTRMKASRRCAVTDDDNGTICFTVSANHSLATVGESTEEDKCHDTTAALDPIRMFGILTPQALRQAQGESIKMVEELIPKIACVNAAMKELEIRIRRARKHGAKTADGHVDSELSSVQ